MMNRFNMEERPHACFVKQTGSSKVIKNKYFSRRHPILSGAIILGIILLIGLLTIPRFFTSSCVTIYNPNINSWNRYVPSYTSKLISDKKATIQPFDFFSDTGFIVVVDCNYEALSISYQSPEDGWWYFANVKYLGNDQYAIAPMPVSLDVSSNPTIVTYRIEINTDTGTEIVYFSIKI